MLFLILLIGYTEMATLYVTYEKIKNFSRVEWLFLLRHIIIYSYDIVLCSFLLNRIHLVPTVFLLYFVTVITILVFLKILKGKKEESLLFVLINKIFRRKKRPIAIALFFLEPFLFSVFYLDNFCEDGKTNKKFWTLVLATSLLSTLIRAGIIYFSGLRI